MGSDGMGMLTVVVFPQDANKAPASSVMMGFAFMCGADTEGNRENAKKIFLC